MPENKYDLIIIGGGPAGLTAGLYAARAQLKTLIIEKMGCGGQAAITDWIENYPGFPQGISGFELTAKMEEQARKFGLEVAIDEVNGIVSSHEDRREVAVHAQSQTHTASALIIASGATHKPLNVPGEQEFRGKGVSYCATCDGPFFREKDVVVVGGGNSAVQEAIYLTRFAKAVTLVHRRERLRATPILQERAKATPRLKLMLGYTVQNITGKDMVDGVTIESTVDHKVLSVPCNGVFIFVGLVPNTAFLKGFAETDENGYIITNDTMRTSVSGVFACGDVRKKILRQVVTAAGEGATAAFAAQEYIDEIKGTSYR
jgi:thioredoxin reductase (NADPH)